MLGSLEVGHSPLWSKLDMCRFTGNTPKDQQDVRGGEGVEGHDGRGRNSWFQGLVLPVSISVYCNSALAFLIYIRIVGRMS